jgi:hypothetical protein
MAAASMAEADSTVVVDADNEFHKRLGNNGWQRKAASFFCDFLFGSKPCTLRRLLARMSGHRSAAVVE